MDAQLIRWCYGPDRTQGALKVGDVVVHTMECPWIESETPGGKPFESCIPDGKYDLVPFKRRNGDYVWCMVNHDLGVYERAEDVPAEGGRYACLIHAANWVTNPHSGNRELYGCIGPGLASIIDDTKTPMVTSSRAALASIHKAMLFGDQHTLTIKPHAGAVNGWKV